MVNHRVTAGRITNDDAMFEQCRSLY